MPAATSTPPATERMKRSAFPALTDAFPSDTPKRMAARGRLKPTAKAPISTMPQNVRPCSTAAPSTMKMPGLQGSEQAAGDPAQSRAEAVGDQQRAQ